MSFVYHVRVLLATICMDTYACVLVMYPYTRDRRQHVSKEAPFFPSLFRYIEYFACLVEYFEFVPALENRQVLFGFIFFADAFREQAQAGRASNCLHVSLHLTYPYTRTERHMPVHMRMRAPAYVSSRRMPVYCSIVLHRCVCLPSVVCWPLHVPRHSLVGKAPLAWVDEFAAEAGPCSVQLSKAFFPCVARDSLGVCCTYTTCLHIDIVVYVCV